VNFARSDCPGRLASEKEDITVSATGILQLFQPEHSDSRLTIDRIQIGPHAHVDTSIRPCRFVNFTDDFLEEGVYVGLEVSQSLRLESLLPHMATAGVALKSKMPPRDRLVESGSDI
jgi:hypothetical protein